MLAERFLVIPAESGNLETGQTFLDARIRGHDRDSLTTRCARDNWARHICSTDIHRFRMTQMTLLVSVATLWALALCRPAQTF